VAKSYIDMSDIKHLEDSSTADKPADEHNINDNRNPLEQLAAVNDSSSEAIGSSEFGQESHDFSQSSASVKSREVRGLPRSVSLGVLDQK